ALINLQYRYSNETSEMWCSRIHYLFRTLLENNPKYFSKNGFIYMTKRSRDRGFMVEKPKRHFVHSNPIQKKGGRNVSSLSSDKVDEIFINYSIYPQSGYCVYNMENEFREKIAYSLFNGAKIIQRAWRAFKLRPETWAKRVWNMVRNDEYNYPSPGEYKEYYLPNNWIERKKEQLNNRLSLVLYIVAFIGLHQHGYRIIEYSGWTYMLKWLSNPEYYHINEFGNERSLEYVRYMCKTHGKLYPCDSLKINYFETKYLYILGEEINIDFLDSNNNC
ncbi:29071_t:CDS:2, partial [Gigaspora margarita]